MLFNNTKASEQKKAPGLRANNNFRKLIFTN